MLPIDKRNRILEASQVVATVLTKFLKGKEENQCWAFDEHLTPNDLVHAEELLHEVNNLIWEYYVPMRFSDQHFQILRESRDS